MTLQPLRTWVVTLWELKTGGEFEQNNIGFMPEKDCRSWCGGI